MKANNIKALDYSAQEKRLTLFLTETTADAVLGMDTGIITIATDAGDTVEAFTGYALRSVVVDASDHSKVTAVLSREAEDTTAKSLDALTSQLTETQAQTKSLQSANTDVMNALAELAGMVSTLSGGATNG